MPYVNIDIDLDDFDTHDLIKELKTRTFSKSEKKLFQTLFENTMPKTETLLNQMKREKFTENIDKFTLDQFEDFLKTI